MAGCTPAAPVSRQRLASDRARPSHEPCGRQGSVRKLRLQPRLPQLTRPCGDVCGAREDLAAGQQEGRGAAIPRTVRPVQQQHGAAIEQEYDSWQMPSSWAGVSLSPSARAATQAQPPTRVADASWHVAAAQPCGSSGKPWIRSRESSSAAAPWRASSQHSKTHSGRAGYVYLARRWVLADVATK
jgi:hypothetical protein